MNACSLSLCTGGALHHDPHQLDEKIYMSGLKNMSKIDSDSSAGFRNAAEAATSQTSPKKSSCQGRKSPEVARILL